MHLGTVVTIGTFDGVHRGHRKIIDKTNRLAEDERLKSLALSFEFPPRLFFSPSKVPVLLTTLLEKRFLLSRYGIGKTVLLNFNRRFSQISALQFFEELLIKKYHAKQIVVGYNFCFGKGREGDIKFLKKIGKKYSIPVYASKPLMQSLRPISSGRIRELIRRGDLRGARRLLGVDYFAFGRVVRGESIGRKMGYPTANLETHSLKILPEGVFVVSVLVFKSKEDFLNSSPGQSGFYGGMCNIGSRPTVAKETSKEKKSFEVHLFGFTGNLYGKFLKVVFLKKLRDEKKFSDQETLKKQLIQDEKGAKSYLKTYPKHC